MTSKNALLEIHGAQFHLNEEGRLQNASDWSDEVAVALAQSDGITLTDEHWEIIGLLRNFYREYNHAPIMKLFLKEITTRLGKEYAHDGYLNKLFPGGILEQSTKISGLPSPHKASLLKDDDASLSVVKGKQDEPKQPGDNQTAFEFNGETYHLTAMGNLVENYAWTEGMGAHLAEREGLVLTDDHWVVLKFMRDFYSEYLVSPMVKLLVKHMKGSIGEEKSNKQYLYELFPEGPSKQGSRIAGLPHPPGCID
jgi:tRNA 2-thiouridine synthesizing protein E